MGKYKKQAIRFLNLSDNSAQYLKVDWVDQEETLSIPQFIDIMTNTKKNYFRRGIAFDHEYKHAFLEQEINGNSFIQIHKKNAAWIFE